MILVTQTHYIININDIEVNTFKTESRQRSRLAMCKENVNCLQMQ